MGPSQICECPFREPRVFEIALLMKKQHWLQIVVRLKTWDTWRNFLERMTWNQQLEQLRTWFVIIHDAPLMHHWITSAFLFSQWTRQIGPSTHFDLRNGLRCHRFDIARNRPGDHTVIILWSYWHTANVATSKIFSRDEHHCGTNWARLVARQRAFAGRRDSCGCLGLRSYSIRITLPEAGHSWTHFDFNTF